MPTPIEAPATPMTVAGSSASVAPRTPNARLLQSRAGKTIHVMPSAGRDPRKTQALMAEVTATHPSRDSQ